MRGSLKRSQNKRRRSQRAEAAVYRISPPFRSLLRRANATDRTNHLHYKILSKRSVCLASAYLLSASCFCRSFCTRTTAGVMTPVSHWRRSRKRYETLFVFLAGVSSTPASDITLLTLTTTQTIHNPEHPEAVISRASHRLQYKFSVTSHWKYGGTGQRQIDSSRSRLATFSDICPDTKAISPSSDPPFNWELPVVYTRQHFGNSVSLIDRV